MKNPERYLSRAEKWLMDAGHQLWFRFALTERNKATAIETALFVEYETKHWELPPANNKNLPKSAAVRMMEDVHKRLPRLLR
jgi:hypothetical protein